MKKIFFIIIFLMLITKGAIAGDVTFVASVDKDKITVDDKIVLTLTVTGIQNPPTPELPKFDGFDVVSSGTSSQFNIINGNMFASKSFNYVLIPKGRGKFTIGSAVFTHEGKEYKTNPIELEVIAGGHAPAYPQASPQGIPQQGMPQAAGQKGLEIGDRTFISVSVDKNEAYINEQITMTFKFYRHDLSIDDLQYTPPVTKNFIEEGVGKQRNYREVINGLIYDIIELKTSLFPVSTGELEITPAKLKCSILVRSQRRRPKKESPFGDLFDDEFFNDPFFDRYVKYPLELASKPIKVKVNPIPEAGRPADFKNAVGNFSMEISVKPEKVKAGEPVTLTMKIMGQGNISSISPPDIPGLSDFKTYEPESKVSAGKEGDRIVGEKIYEKILVPEKSGKQSIPKIVFSFFDPADGTYKTLEKGPYEIDVAPAPPGGVIHGYEQMVPANGRKAVKILKQDILYIKTTPGGISAKRKPLINNALFLSVQAIPVLAFFFIFAAVKRKERLLSDVGYARGRQAYRRALDGIKEAKRHILQGGERSFYGSLYKTLTNFLGDKLNIPSGGITADIVSTLESKGISPQPAEKLKTIFAECDMGQFATAVYDPDKMKALLKEMEELIKSLNRHL